MTDMTPEELNALCADWQKRLRLMDWKIAVSFVPGYEMPDRAGECSSFEPMKEAVIRINKDTHNPYSRICAAHPEGFEEVLVHELLEIHFTPFKDDDGESRLHMAQEQAINMIASALVQARRGASPEKS